MIPPEVLWACTTCGACVDQCPVDIEHVDHVVDMRRQQVLMESAFPKELGGMFRKLESKGNPWGLAARKRMDWAKGLDFEVPVVGEDVESMESVDWLFWIGCAGAYEDRAKKTVRAVAELLHLADISFGVLGNGETCTGDPARRAGNEFVYQGLAAQNVETLGGIWPEQKVKQVVTTCPHCLNTLKNEYRDFGLELEVVHHTQLLNRLVRDGRLTPVASGEGATKRTITYHDRAYEDRAKRTTRAVAELLHIAGVSFAVLGEGETCTGDPARRAGNEILYQMLAAQNVARYWARAKPARGIRPGARATRSSTRCSPPRMWRRSMRRGRSGSWSPARTASTRSRRSTRRSAGATRSCTTLSCWPAWCARAA